MYKVMKCYSRGSEIMVGSYPTAELAKKTILSELAKDISLKVNTTYRLYEGFDLVEEFDANSVEVATEDESEGGQGAGSPGAGSKQVFSPTPFSMTPQLGPRTWVKEVAKEDKEEDKDKK